MQYTHYMHKKIQEVAQVISGYTFRGAIEKALKGSVSVLQATNIKSGIDISDTSVLISLSEEPGRTLSYLEKNDIVLVSRGSGQGSFRSCLFVSEERNVIASSSVFIIRVKDVTVLPKYLSLYLNSDDGQKEILQIVTGGSYLQSLLRRSLEDLKVPIPPIGIQKSIIALNENIQEQEKIVKRKSIIKQNIINSTFKNLINK